MNRLATIVAFCLMGAAVAAQAGSAQQSGVIEEPSVGASAVFIVNRGSAVLGFAVRPYDGQWSSYDLQPGQNMKIVCSNCNTDGFDIALKTGTQEVNYKLPSGQRFSLEWNNARGIWDVFRIAS